MITFDIQLLNLQPGFTVVITCFLFKPLCSFMLNNLYAFANYCPL